MSRADLTRFTRALDGMDDREVLEALDRSGFWSGQAVLDSEVCAELAELYDAGASLFRSTIAMGRHGFGRGEYKYFARPLPQGVDSLRKALYRRLAPVANAWNLRFGKPAVDWPAEHEALVERCALAGQSRPTPLLLRYGVGDYNCLHQDLYGEIHFPLQAQVSNGRSRVPDLQPQAASFGQRRWRLHGIRLFAPIGSLLKICTGG